MIPDRTDKELFLEKQLNKQIQYKEKELIKINEHLARPYLGRITIKMLENQKLNLENEIRSLKKQK